MRLLFTAELGGTRSTSCSSQRALSLVMKLGGGLPLKNFTCICVFAIESTIIVIWYCQCNLQYYLSDLHVYIVSVQCCGITSTVEQLLLSLLSDVIEAMTRVWKTESTKKNSLYLLSWQMMPSVWMGIGRLTCLLTMGKKVYKR